MVRWNRYIDGRRQANIEVYMKPPYERLENQELAIASWTTCLAPPIQSRQRCFRPHLLGIIRSIHERGHRRDWSGIKKKSSFSEDFAMFRNRIGYINSILRAKSNLWIIVGHPASCSVVFWIFYIASVQIKENCEKKGLGRGVCPTQTI